MSRLASLMTVTLISASVAAADDGPAAVKLLDEDVSEVGFPVDLTEPPCDQAGDCDDAVPVRLNFPVSGALRFESVSAIGVDRDGNEHAPGPTLDARFRIGLTIDTGTHWAPWRLGAETEHDLPTGTVGPIATLEGDDYPRVGRVDHQLRKAFIRADLDRSLGIHVGWMTSHWGLGLLANDGAHGWEPGSARFADPRGGDRVARVRVSSGPHETGGLLAVFAADILDGDYFADDDVLLEGDRANQLTTAIRAGSRDNFVGVYTAYRSQVASEGQRDGAETEVFVLDVHARGQLGDERSRFSIEGEAALIVGTTELAPTVDFPVHDVRAFGAAVRMMAEAGRLGAVFDVLYASGDRNLDDGTQNAFKTDPNFDMGLLLFSQVLRAQTARAVFTAGDPALVGVPADDLERIPTRGSATNTLALFPRLRLRILDGFEVYGGPLLALAAVPVADPLNSRVNGGIPHSPLGGQSGGVLGVEADAGLRYRLNAGGVEMTLGVEGGVLFPGNAMLDLSNQHMTEVVGGRTMLDVRL